MTYEWTLYACDKNGRRQTIIEDYKEAELNPVYCDVGTWSLKLHRATPAAFALCNPGWGLVAARNGVVVASGPATDWSHTFNADTNEVEISGATDDVWLTRRLVSPSPAETGPPYIAQVSDVRTGPASTVLIGYVNANLGPGAVPARRKSNFTMAPDPVIGSTVKGEGRWDSDLLTLLQPLALTGGVGFRVARVGTGMQFQVYTPTDRSATVKFAVGLGNLQGFEYTSKAPRVNYVFVGGAGTGTSRVVKEYPDDDSIATWERIEGPLVNQGSTSDPTQILQAALDAFEQDGEQASLSITPIETDDLRFGEHYFLGDKVSVQLGDATRTPYANDGQIVDILRQVNIKLTPDGSTVTPSIGTAARTDRPKFIQLIRTLGRRVNNLEKG